MSSCLKLYMLFDILSRFQEFNKICCITDFSTVLLAVQFPVFFNSVSGANKTPFVYDWCQVVLRDK